MNMNQSQLYGFSEKGKRSNNEDCVYPDLNTVTPELRVVIVCDGVGGAEKGEVASSIVCTELSKFLLSHDSISDQVIEMGVKHVEDSLSKFIATNPYSEGMATTMALAVIQNDKAILVHIGDSRMYFFRNNELIYMSEDHSLVNEMVHNGIISTQEALTHPKRNVITRAITGRHRQAEAEFKTIENIQSGDLLFMCSDGVLESFNTETLSKVLTSSAQDIEKAQSIKAHCESYSKDNYSAYLLRL